MCLFFFSARITPPGGILSASARAPANRPFPYSPCLKYGAIRCLIISPAVPSVIAPSRP